MAKNRNAKNLNDVNAPYEYNHGAIFFSCSYKKKKNIYEHLTIYYYYSILYYYLVFFF